MDLHHQFPLEAIGDVSRVPLRRGIRLSLMLKGVRGPIQVRNDATWHVYPSDRD